MSSDEDVKAITDTIEIAMDVTNDPTASSDLILNRAWLIKNLAAIGTPSVRTKTGPSADQAISLLATALQLAYAREHRFISPDDALREISDAPVEREPWDERTYEPEP